MSNSLPNLQDLKPSELLHVHHGCMVAIRVSLAMGDDGVDDFIQRAESVAAEMHNRANPQQAVEVPEHRKLRRHRQPA